MRYEFSKKADGKWIKSLGTNKRGESLEFCISVCVNPKGKHSLPNLWYQYGWTPKAYNTYLACRTYVTDSEGRCRQDYNPTIDNETRTLDFEWVLEADEGNENMLIDEVLRRFESAEGKSATEIRMEKIHKYADENNLEMVFELPDGWKTLYQMDAPYGTCVIGNVKSTFKKVGDKYIINPDYKRKLYVVINKNGNREEK